MGALVRAGRREGPRLATEEAAAQGRQYLTFSQGSEVFAADIVSIREIIEYREPTPVPMMPAMVRGIINLRGQVVPVIDLAVRFGRDSRPVTRRTCVVIVETAGEHDQDSIGVIVDGVNEVLDIADADIEAAPSFGAKLRNDFIKGMGKLGERFVIVLDLDHVLSQDELAMLSESRVAAGPADPGVGPESPAAG